MTTQPVFHYAFPVLNLARTRAFYIDILGCVEGRAAERWVDFNFFGHQISAHLSDHHGGEIFTNKVETKAIPIPHFGLVMAWDAFFELAESLKQKNIAFIHPPMIRFEGRVGEQATMFLSDPSGNVLEFKSFRNPNEIFSQQTDPQP